MSIRRSLGQATVELVLVFAALGTLTTAGAWLFDVQHTQRATIHAARFAAFERALFGGALDDAALARDLDARFFHRLPHARGRSTAPTISSERGPLAVGGARTLLGVYDAANVVATGVGDLERGGQWRATVATRFGGTPRDDYGFTIADLDLRESLVIVGDGWTASGPAQTAQRVARWAPSAAARGAAPQLRAVARLLRVLPGSYLERLCVGRIDPEIVPRDRLVPSRSGVHGRWAAPC